MRKSHQILWFVVLFSGLLTSLTAGWYIQAGQNYNYDFWYDWYDIGAHIDKFGPQNRYISGFETLDKPAYSHLFNQIVYAVHHQGVGLADIKFTTEAGQTKPLLRQPEVVHLQDVANLIEKISLLGMSAAVVALVLGRGLMRRGIQPQWKAQGLCLAGLLVIIGAVLLIAGPKEVFYQLHVWIFPDNHEWFFYYQDSLMSTLMKAPFLFGGIAAAIAATGAVLYAVLIVALLWWQRKQKPA
ncbi:MAG: DUF1461 domain-containing protein [Oceanospirillaceae bacterium]|uniref:lipoprotein intramolecular transacylase Lit n=1 Tax=unclassified Thalassolituus TaxID=2624967 RepID=UPI000C0AA063|nr:MULTISPECIES: DUF1461 domain-containing protein [unclassified Thalassolituus]MAK91705.1 DUF1461 domain-containing protein [Thalassolituus sp.]MBL34820.1 DUF1461 domain-containing protein [Oceanospirillaceae bacterium]MBS53440.1 DUF1461 domain-containing protein [Oceanospirillaceae bacterium]|tara:strand:+ start:291 stop:1013 length:723 start_codon:yes stop_codon:yes gene_type:complete